MLLEISKKQYSGQEMRLGNESYKIDNKGCFEVENETGAQELINKYDFVFEQGKIPAPESKINVSEIDEEKVTDILLQLEIQKGTVKQKQKEVDELKEEVKTWRNEFGNAMKLLTDNGIEYTKTAIEKEEEKISDDEDKSEYQLKIEAMEFDELKTFAKSIEVGLQGIKNKEQLVKKLVELEK